MAKENPNVHVYSDGNYAVWTAPIGTTVPATLPPTNPGTGYVECGLLSDAGITEAHTMNETKIFDLAGSLVRIARNQEERPWTFECLEENAVQMGLQFPGTTVTNSGGTAAVHTVTMTASGGTWIPSHSVFGSAASQAFNVPTATLQTALRAAWNEAVTVTGTAGTSYVITYPVTAGAVTLLSLNTSALTGGTATAALTTPGVAGVNSRPVGAGTGRNLRQFAVDLVDGSVHKRINILNGEAVWTGTKTYSGGAATISQFTLNPFKDANGVYYTVLDDDPANGETFA